PWGNHAYTRLHKKAHRIGLICATVTASEQTQATEATVTSVCSANSSPGGSTIPANAGLRRLDASTLATRVAPARCGRTSMLSNRRRMAVCVAVVLLLYSPRLMAQDARAERDAPAQTGVSSSPSEPSRERPFALKALYVSLAALEALDVHS